MTDQQKGDPDETGKMREGAADKKPFNAGKGKPDLSTVGDNLRKTRVFSYWQLLIMFVVVGSFGVITYSFFTRTIGPVAGGGWWDTALFFVTLVALLAFLFYLMSFAGSNTLSRQVYATIRSMGWIGLAVLFGFVLSFASFLTTMEGMINFTRVDGNAARAVPMAYLLAAAVSFGVQGVLFILSWIVAQDLAARSRYNDEHGTKGFVGRFFSIFKRENPDEYVYADLEKDRKPAMPELPSYLITGFPKVVMLLIAMFASMFFSFDSLFDRVFKEAERNQVQLSYARSETSSAFSQMRDGIFSSRAELLDNLRGGEAWRSYNRNLNLVLDTALTSEGTIAAALRQQSQTRQLEANNLRRQLDDKQKAILDKEKEAAAIRAGETASLAANPDTLRSEIADLEQRLTAVQAKADQLATDMAVEERKGKPRPDGGFEPCNDPRGCRGPRWRELEKEKGVVDAELGSLTSILEGKRSELGAIETGASTREARLGATEAELRNLKSEAEILQQQYDAALTQVNSVGIGSVASTSGDLDMASLVNEISAAKLKFESSGDAEAYGKMVEGCAGLLAVLQQKSDQIPAANSLSCDVSGIADTADTLRSYNIGLLAFDRDTFGRLKEQIAQAQTAGDTRRLPDVQCFVDQAFNELPTVKAFIDRGQQCLNVANLPFTLSEPIRSRLDTVERENSPETSNFTRTIASLKRWDLLGWTALALAVAIDLLVFFSAIAGAFAENRNRKGDDDSPLGMPPTVIDPNHDPDGAIAMKLLVSHTVAGPSADGGIKRLISLSQIHKANYRILVRSLLTSRPEREVTMHRRDVFEISERLYKRVIEELRKETRYLSFLYPDYLGNHTREGGSHGYDEDGVGEADMFDDIFETPKPKPATQAGGGETSKTGSREPFSVVAENGQRVEPRKPFDWTSPEGNAGNQQRDPNAGKM